MKIFQYIISLIIFGCSSIPNNRIDSVIAHTNELLDQSAVLYDSVISMHHRGILNDSLKINFESEISYLHTAISEGIELVNTYCLQTNCTETEYSGFIDRIKTEVVLQKSDSLKKIGVKFNL